MKGFAGRIAVVTGGGSGFGLEVARLAAREGMRVVLADVQHDALQAAADELLRGGAQVLTQQLDVSRADEVEALAVATQQHFGAPHFVFNNAGVGSGGLVWESSLQDWTWVLGVNLMGVVHGVRSFVPRMLAAGDEGHIVNTASVAGLLTGPGPYFASKHGVSCLTEGLYKDLKAAGAKLSASVLCPGVIRTQILEAERNRPAQFGGATDLSKLSETAQQFSAGFRAALQAGLDPAVVADAVADAVVHDRFYIVPAQPEYLERIATRMADVAALRNPTLPPKP